jgi:hypothetical protein
MLPMKLDTLNRPAPAKRLEHKQAAHRPETLNQQFDLARRFLEAFPIDAPFSHERFDQWGIEVGEIEHFPGELKKGSKEALFRLKQRMDLKGKINLGGMSPNFSTAQKFQLEIEETGKSCRVVSLMTAIHGMHSDLPSATLKRVKGRRRDLELMISAIGIGNLGLEQRLLAEQALRSTGNYELMLEPLGEIIANDLRALERSLEAAGQGNLMTMIEDQREPQNEQREVTSPPHP